MRLVEWVVLSSTLCNLRCRYCYAWEGLADPTRIGLDDWRTLLVAIRDYHEIQAARSAGRLQSRIVWHGGEPLILPDDYWAAVLDLQREVLGNEALDSGAFCNRVQTNLTRLSDAKIALLQRGRFGVGVSMDYVSGVRLDVAGRPTEVRVARNIDRLRAAGVPMGAITVLGGHTRPHLRTIHDLWAELGLPFRILPMHAAPMVTPGAAYAISPQEIDDALCELFEHWFGRGCPVRVTPLDDYLQTALLSMLGLKRDPWDRRLSGDCIFLVDPRGALLEPRHPAEPQAPLGNVFAQPIRAILESARYAESLDASDDRVRRHCASCALLGACDTTPLHQLADDALVGRCAEAQPVVSFIERHLEACGFSAVELEALAQEISVADAASPI